MNTNATTNNQDEIALTEEMLKRVCNNAKLQLTEKETAAFLKDTEEVLNAFRTLSQADITKTEPAFQPIPLPTVLREDSQVPSLTQEEAVTNATSINGCIKGPRAI